MIFDRGVASGVSLVGGYQREPQRASGGLPRFLETVLRGTDEAPR
jgi:hypothetical protein